MLNFYLIYVLKVEKEDDDDDKAQKTPIILAIVPAIIYIFTVLTSTFIPTIYKSLKSRKKTYTIAAGI